MRKLLLVAAVCSFAACKPSASLPALDSMPSLDSRARVQTIAVGSCLDQTSPMPILADVLAKQPDAVILMGDNVYADASSQRELERAYATLGSNPRYRALADAVPIFATWDDHDYGRNDAGAEYELKEESKTAMLDFFGEAANSARRTRAGNYDATIVGPPGARVQIILLDTRWFRGPFSRKGMLSGYVPYEQGKDSPTILGEAQWQWLETQLREPAELRLLVTSIQLVHTEHRFESWGLFPSERQRMLTLIGKTEAEGVVLLSGDRHRGELSCLDRSAAGYPLFELTASSFNRPSHSNEDNRFRRPGTPLVGDPHFGTVEIDWEANVVTLTLQTLGGTQVLSEGVPLGALRKRSGSQGIPDCEPD